MLTIFSVSITIYLQQLHLNLIYIDMYQDCIKIILKYISIKIQAISMTPILYISMWMGGPEVAT